MAECSEIEAGGEVRTIKDATARQGVATNVAAITEINNKVSPIGTVIKNTTTPSISASSSGKTEYIRIADVPPGTYLVNWRGRQADDAQCGGRVFANISQIGQIVVGVNFGSNWNLLYSGIITLTTTQTVTLSLYFETSITANPILNQTFTLTRIK